MCLSKLLPMPKRTRSYGYVVREKRGNGYYSVCRKSSITQQLGEKLRSSDGLIRAEGLLKYEAGFHIWKCKADAFVWKNSREVVLRVRYSGAVAFGTQGTNPRCGNVVVAKNLTLIEEIQCVSTD